MSKKARAVVIADRVLRRADGGPDIIVRLFLPERDGLGYRCNYEIEGVGETFRRYATGADSIHAIQMALAKIGIDLNLHAKYKDIALVFGDTADSGFPKPEV